MIEEFLPDEPDAATVLSDVEGIEKLLQRLAKKGRAVSYSEILLMLGFRFSRPKMRALCRTMDEVDRRAAARGEPELAALVVRESDRLPGQGWWIGRTDYQGSWTGPEARAFLSSIQQHSFDYWRKH
jgi:hypothetical protein